MTKPRMLECCECGADALPSTGRMEHDRRRAGWFDGDSGECPKCKTKLRVYVEPDYPEDRLARPVTESEYCRRRGLAEAAGDRP